VCTSWKRPSFQCWIGLDHEEIILWLRHPRSLKRYCCVNLQGYEDLISLTNFFASRRSNLGSISFVFVGFFVFYAAEPFSGIRVRSVRRSFTRVKCNVLL
jgi:hypothetical protein